MGDLKFLSTLKVLLSLNCPYGTLPQPLSLDFHQIRMSQATVSESGLNLTAEGALLYWINILFFKNTIPSL